MSLSAYLSALVRRHAWDSQSPPVDSARQAVADQRTVELDEYEATRWRGESERRAAGELWHAPSSLRDRVILPLSSQVIIDQGATMLCGVEADPEDPGPLLLVVRLRSTGNSAGSTSSGA